MRGFEEVKKEYRKHNVCGILPKRSTKNSAGYDFYTPIDIVIPAHGKITFFTNIKAYMQPDEVLMIYIRSSIGIKKGIRLANGTGVIDSDYYSNEDNDGNIGICLVNDTDEDVVFNAGDKIAQGIFIKYLIADGDDTNTIRSGGIGSTGIK